MRRTGVSPAGSSATSSNRLVMSGCPFAVVGDPRQDARHERPDDVAFVVRGTAVIGPWSCCLGGELGGFADAVGAQRLAYERLRRLGCVDRRRTHTRQCNAGLRDLLTGQLERHCGTCGCEVANASFELEIS